MHLITTICCQISASTQLGTDVQEVCEDRLRSMQRRTHTFHGAAIQRLRRSRERSRSQAPLALSMFERFVGRAEKLGDSSFFMPSSPSRAASLTLATRRIAETDLSETRRARLDVTGLGVVEQFKLQPPQGRLVIPWRPGRTYLLSSLVARNKL